MSPRTAAFPISETPSGLPKYSGKIVTMSMRSVFFRPTPAPYIPIRLLRLGVVKQSGRRIDDHDAGPDVDLGHDRLHERDQSLAARFVLAPHHQQVLAVVQDVGDDADRVARTGPHGQADQLVVTELVRVTDFRQLAGVHAQPAAGQLGGRGPVGNPGERDQQLPRVPARRGHREAPFPRGGDPLGSPRSWGGTFPPRPPRPPWRGSQGGSYVHGGAHGEPEVRLVRPDPDHDLATDPVRTANPADDYPHRVSGPRWRPAGRSGRSGRPPGRRSRYAAPGRCARPSR